MTQQAWPIREKSAVRLGDVLTRTGAFDPSASLTKEVFQRDADDLAPSVSFVVPVHNQAGRIADNLLSITSNAWERHELIVVLDGCTDSSESEVTTWANSVMEADAGLLRVIILTSPSDLFETICDNLGVAAASGRFVIEVQADMHIEQPGFDSFMLAALDAVPELALVSGRGAHSFPGRRPAGRERVTHLARRTIRKAYGLLHARRGAHAVLPFEWRFSDEIGRVGPFIETPLGRSDVSFVYLHQTVMRGPLAYSKTRFEQLGGLDSNSFFLGDDDHDLALRAWALFEWRSGYLPLAFSSPLNAGSTRSVRTPEAERRFRELRAHYVKARKGSFLDQNVSRLSLPRPRRVPVSKPAKPTKE